MTGTTDTLPSMLIGIDGGTHTGVATYCDTDGYTLLTMTFWEAYDYVRALSMHYALRVYIEHPSGNLPVFATGKVNGKARERIAQSVGRVKRESELLADGLKRCGLTVTLVVPRGRKGSRGKWTAADLLAATGYAKRSSQHARDAARLIVGR
jgi:hypothetical protein